MAATRFVLQPAEPELALSGPSAAVRSGCAGSPEEAWEHALTDYQRVLDQHRDLLARVGQGDEQFVVVPAFQPPAGLPPLPESMLTWAEGLSRATDELVQQATEFLERTRPAAAPPRLGRFLTDAAASFDRKM